MSDPAAYRGRAGDGAVLRRLASQEDYAACVELQRQTWGRRFGELVPASILKVSQRVGGVAAGAFDPAGQLLGFVWGLSGIRPGSAPDPSVPAGPGGSVGSAGPASPGGLAGPGDSAGPAGSDGSGPGTRGGTPADGHEKSADAGAHRPRIVHWSHMLAVSPEARDRGLGTRLKLYQRELLLPLGVEVVEWTYDPLEARNAHLNLNHLGAEVAEYVPDMYRGEVGSELWRGLGTDRFVVAWRIAGPRAAAAHAGEPAAAARFAAAPAAGEDDGPALPEAPRVRVEIAADIQALKAAQPERARAWRRRTRHAFTTYMERGWRVEAFFREPSGRCFYGLEREEGRACESSASP
jgi:predicted GNAT superfamily acetyltransferase